MPRKPILVPVLAGLILFLPARAPATINIASASETLATNAVVKGCTDPFHCSTRCQGCGSQTSNQGFNNTDPARGPANLTLPCPGCSVTLGTDTVSVGPTQLTSSLRQTILPDQPTVVFQISASGAAHTTRLPGSVADNDAVPDGVFPPNRHLRNVDCLDRQRSPDVPAIA